MPGWMKFALVVLILAGAAGAYLHLVNPELGRELLGDSPIAPAPSVTTAYKWRDANGNWQLTDQPPPDGVAYERLETSSDVNVMPSLETKKD